MHYAILVLFTVRPTWDLGQVYALWKLCIISICIMSLTTVPKFRYTTSFDPCQWLLFGILHCIELNALSWSCAELMNNISFDLSTSFNPIMQRVRALNTAS